jgi:hypothetical protein
MATPIVDSPKSRTDFSYRLYRFVREARFILLYPLFAQLRCAPRFARPL